MNFYFICITGYSFTIVDMVVLDTDKPTGKVIINKEIRAIEMIEQKVSKPSGICEGKSEMITVQNITFRYEDLADLVFEVKLPQPPQPSQPPQPPQPVRERKNLNLVLPLFKWGLFLKKMRKIPMNLGMYLSSTKSNYS